MASAVSRGEVQTLCLRLREGIAASSTPSHAFADLMRLLIFFVRDVLETPIEIANSMRSLSFLSTPDDQPIFEAMQS